MKGSINSIESFSTVDGPGVRSTVFMQGCSLRCKFCHNPETWHITENNYTVDELYNKLKRYYNYYGKEGGVTFSGGEPLLQNEYITEVCKLLKKDNINIALDTAGIGPYKEILNYVDIILYDIKDITENRYHDLTGGNINQTLEFINYAKSLKKDFIIRLVVIPEVNDTKEYMDELNKYIHEHFDDANVKKIEFLPFHQSAKDKYHKLNINYPYEDKCEMNIDKCNELYNYFISIYKK